MKTVDDIKRGILPLILVAQYKNLYLCKYEFDDTFYFIVDKDIIKEEIIENDNYKELNIKLLNREDVEETKKLIVQEKSYKEFKQFVKDQLNEEFTF